MDPSSYFDQVVLEMLDGGLKRKLSVSVKHIQNIEYEQLTTSPNVAMLTFTTSTTPKISVETCPTPKKNTTWRVVCNHDECQSKFDITKNFTVIAKGSVLKRQLVKLCKSSPSLRGMLPANSAQGTAFHTVPAQRQTEEASFPQHMG